MNARYSASERNMLLSLLTPSVFTLVQHPFDINALTPFRGRLKAPCMAAWSDPEWRWGCADGTAHAVATRLKTSLSTAEARSRFLTDVGMLDEEDWEDSKVVLALKCQRAAQRCHAADYGLDEDAQDSWQSLADDMASCKFEGYGGDLRLVEAIGDRLSLSESKRLSAL